MSKSEREIAIGIDLGTSNSCVAVLCDGDVEVLPNAYGEPITASVVSVQGDGSIVVGNAAKSNLIHDPTNTISSSKRLMGRYYFSEEVKKAQAICSYEISEGPNHGVRVQVHDESFSPPELAAMVLRELKSLAETRLGQPISKAVITVPANFNDNQRQATKDAGRIAGLDVLRILNEPTAAAVSYGFGKGLNQQVAIYDLGGGTFDVSVLEIGRDVFEVLSTCGDTFLGGDDFDDRVLDLLADEFMEQHGINLRNDRFALEKLRFAAESAKKTLSVDESAEIRIPDIVAASEGREAISLERTLDIEEFSGLVADLVQRTFKVCDEALQQAGVVARDLDGVILVGGPTRLPIIRNAVKNYFQQEPKTDVDPDQVVAMGAAIHAATLVDSERKAFLLDVTPLSLRIGVAGGLAESIIERNTPVPIEQTRNFTTFQDDQESVVIRVYQGESRTAEENELLGQFEFSDFKKARRGEVQIDVTFEIDADGIVAVKARDPETGKEASTRISLSSGLSEHEVSDIIEQRRTDRVVSDAPDAAAIGSVELVSKIIPSDTVPQIKEAPPSEPLDTLPLPADPDTAQTAPPPEIPDDETPTGELEVLPDDSLAVEGGSDASLELAGSAEIAIDSGSDESLELADSAEIAVESSSDAPLELTVEIAPADPASEAPTDELQVYDDEIDEELDLLAEIELDPIDVPLPDAPDTQVTSPRLPSDDAMTDADENLFDTPGTDLSELPGDEPENA
ncbi:MAG: Hsp70 family protein [Deltaproteobacteria bacterium]|nr:Hsp70 family protein [Deltaproteobacteria bacterium]MBW2361070.1 Hsp70 family protein [Deltaproteobacteria bacterium]